MTQTAVAYFFYSLGILFREGMEAMLVVVALAAATRGTGRIGRSRDVYAGAVAAIVASVVLAWVVNHIITDDASDALEGVFQLFAAATLFYVSSWMTSKGQSDRWMKFISQKLESAERSTIPGIALGLTAFLAVMREGAETIVFFQALTSGATEAAERHAVTAGIVVAAVALAASFVIIRRAADRIPMRIFFQTTSIMLYALAIVFVGQGVASLQEASIVSATFVNYAPTIPMLGVFPTIQSLGAQAVLLMLAAPPCSFHATLPHDRSGLPSRRRCSRRSGARLELGRLRHGIVAAEQNGFHVGTQLLGHHQRPKPQPRALIDRRVVRDRTLTHVPERDAQILRAIEQDGQPRCHDRGRIPPARRKIERQRFVVFRVGQRTQRIFDFGAGRFGAVVGRPG